MSKNKLLLIALIYFSCCSLFGQNCGTKLPSGYLQKVYQLMSSPMYYPQDTCLNKELSIVLHVVLDSSGAPGVIAADLATMVQNLNDYFRPICLSFKSCSTNYVPNYNYNQWTDYIHEPTMFANYHADSTINIYLVDAIISPGGASGYAAMPGGDDIIVLQKNSVTDLTPIHEMGHFFGLPHTFETTGGSELVLRTNCYTSGDGFCDTEADPYPAGDTPGAPCDYTYNATDANGNYYTPPLDNIMTYFKACRCRFTQEQYNYMALMYSTVRNYLH